jgi:peptidoglycan hydrolase-like protein with peptidoglycan-binding domain
MKNSRYAVLATLALFAAADVARPALAQSTSPAPVGAGAKTSPTTTDGQKAAFLAMPEADRKAVQDALVWLGFYNGLVDGEFGKRTLDSLLAYQASVKAPADGIVSAPQLLALKAAPEKARATVGFQTLDDAATGIRIGAPMKLLEKRTGAAGLTRLTSRDGSISLDLLAPTGAQNSLAELYSLLTADAPGRKVTYRTMKPGAFFVVSGEQASRKFYTRYEQSGEGGATRGFSFAFPAGKAGELDRVALALLNSFEPFPAAVPAVAAKAPQTPIAPATPSAEAPTASRSPGVPILTATALIVAPGQALTALSEAECPTPTIEGKPAAFGRTEVATGLALLSGDFRSGAAPLRLNAGGPDLIVLSLTRDSGAGNTVLETADASLMPISGTRNALVAALSMSARGAPVFDRQAGLISIVAPIRAETRRIGSVLLAQPHELIGIEALKTFVSLPGAEPDAAKPPLRAAEIASEMRGAIVGVYCAP